MTQRIRLVGLKGPFEGAVWDSSEALLRVGRVPSDEVHLDDSSVSRHHAEILGAGRDPGRHVRDLNSTNGTYLNGRRIGSEWQRLRRGDVLRFGDVSMSVTDLEPDVQFPSTTRLLWRLSDVLRPRGLAANPYLSQLGGRAVGASLPWLRDFTAIPWTDGQRLATVCTDALALFPDASEVTLLRRGQPGADLKPAATVGRHLWIERDLVQELSRHSESFLWGVERSDNWAFGERQVGSALYLPLRDKGWTWGCLLVTTGLMQEDFSDDDLLRGDAFAAAVAPALAPLIDAVQPANTCLELPQQFALSGLSEEVDWWRGDEPRRMLDFLRGRADDRKLRLFCCAACRAAWGKSPSSCVRSAVEVAERWAEGRATEAEVAAARQEAMAAAVRESASPSAGPTAAESFPQADSAAAAAGPLHEDAWSGAFACMELLTGSHGPALVAALHDLFGKLPFHPALVEPAWLACNGGAVAQMARVIYDEGRFEELPFLADALEAAGCTHVEMLAHLRSGGVHVRGCWVLDRLLGLG